MTFLVHKMFQPFSTEYLLLLPCCVPLQQLRYENTKEHPVPSLYSPLVVSVLSHTRALSLSVLLAMEELDGDEVRVSSRGRLAERDIVQVLIIILFNFAG